MKIYSINPATGIKGKSFDLLNDDQIKIKIDKSQKAFELWKNCSIKNRSKIMKKVAANLRKNKEAYAKTITLEMGKRISESISEIEKCAWVCDYYAENAENILTPTAIKTEARKSYISYEPLGIILAVMPWNFPFWQVFRCAAPALMAGNSVLLKHASNVPESAVLIEKIFVAAGLPIHVIQTLLIGSTQVEVIVSDTRVRAVSLTGSEGAGVSVASLAGKYIKKTIMELGGSDPFIVLDDADIKKAASMAANSRMIVSGQSCIAAKRFIVHKQVFKEFVNMFKQNLENRIVGDPMDTETGIGPLVSEQTLEIIDDQVKKSVSMGAKIVTGGKKVDRNGFYYLPTILTEVTPKMPVFNEETFGPVAAVISVADEDEAVFVANNSRFGLGASLWTKNKNKIEKISKELQSGCVFVNTMVKSDPRLPFGGTKFSGYGRELSDFGIREFVNIKSVWIE